MLRVGRWTLGVVCGLAVSCGDPEQGSGTETDTEGETDSSSSTPCTPGESIPCACTDGTMSTQDCRDDGTGYDPCMCGSSTTTGTSSTMGGTNPTTMSTSVGTTDTDATTTDSADSGSSETAERGCEPFEVVTCQGCDFGPGWQECNAEGTDFGQCICCEGGHPIVEGDMRFCPEGICYCGALEMEPPLDICYPQAIADACCPVDLVCY